MKRYIATYIEKYSGKIWPECETIEAKNKKEAMKKARQGAHDINLMLTPREAKQQTWIVSSVEPEPKLEDLE